MTDSTAWPASTLQIAWNAIPPSRWPAAFSYGIARIKGLCYILYYRARRKRFVCGPRLRVFGSLNLKGPGLVRFGADVAVYGKCTPWTHSAEAKIIIGDNVMIGDTRFGCAREISIGNHCILADARIMDTDFHSIGADRRSPSAPVRVKPVRVGHNVWIGAAAALLPGTVIGENSVVGYGAVCNRKYPPDKVIIGNPAKVALPVPATGKA